MDNRKFSDRQKKNYKFNVIDFVLIVIILAAVFHGIALYIHLRWKNTKKVPEKISRTETARF